MIKSIINPIKENRIVSDITFATRFLNFLESFYYDSGSWHPILEEEYEYLCIIAKQLLDYQKSTMNNSDEYEYFKNLESNKINMDFEKFLKLLENGK